VIERGLVAVTGFQSVPEDFICAQRKRHVASELSNVSLASPRSNIRQADRSSGWARVMMIVASAGVHVVHRRRVPMNEVESLSDRENMDDETALTEAQRRWGPGAWIDDELSSRHQVGYVGDTAEVIMGSGATWEEAFADADRRGAEDADSDDDEG
jgi:hypothetical protein